MIVRNYDKYWLKSGLFGVPGMARIIIHTAKSPHVFNTPKGDTVAICMCGLSQKYPFCDGSHTKTRDEADDALYAYDQEGNKINLATGEKIRKV